MAVMVNVIVPDAISSHRLRRLNGNFGESIDPLWNLFTQTTRTNKRLVNHPPPKSDVRLSETIKTSLYKSIFRPLEKNLVTHP